MGSWKEFVYGVVTEVANGLKREAWYHAMHALCQKAGLMIDPKGKEDFVVRGSGPHQVWVTIGERSGMATLQLISYAKLTVSSTPGALGLYLLNRNAQSPLYAWRADEDSGVIGLSLFSTILIAGASESFIRTVFDGMCAEAEEVEAKLRQIGIG